MKKGEEEQLERELGPIWTEAVSCALESLWSWCPNGEKPRLHDTAKAYAKRVIDECGRPGGERREQYLAAVKTRIEELIADNEMKVRELTEETDWDRALLIAIATAHRKYGSSQILDRDVLDWIQEAALQFLDRSRHYSAQKKVKLTTWLVQTARSNIAHARRDAAKHPRESFETRRPPRKSRGTHQEDRSDGGSNDSDDEDAGDADFDRRHPAHSGLHLSTAR